MFNLYASNMQLEVSECGLACLAHVSQKLGSHRDLAALRRKHPVSNRGMSLKQIVDIAADIGLRSRAVRCEVNELKDISLPAILHWNEDHFVVLEKVSRRSIQIFDPVRGIMNIPVRRVPQSFTGIAVELEPSPNFKKIPDREQLRIFSLMSWTPAVKKGLIQALIFTFFMQAYLMVSPLFIKTVVDDTAAQAGGHLLTALTLGFGFLVLFNAGATFLRGVALQKVSASLNWDMSRRMFHHLVRLPLSWFQSRKLADVLTRFSSLDPVRNAIANGLVTTSVDGILVIGVSVMMLVMSPLLSLISIIALVISSLTRIVSRNHLLSVEAGALQALIAEKGKRIETIRSIQTIKAMGSELERENVWANKLADVVSANEKTGIARLSVDTAQATVDALGYLIVVYVGTKLIGAQELSIGGLYAFIMYHQQLFQRTSAVVIMCVEWTLLKNHTFRLADVVLTSKEKVGSTSDDRRDFNVLSLDRVGFKYNGSEAFALRNCTLTVERGENVAIIGASGAGKSTLLKVISGLYAPTQGDLSLDGVSYDGIGKYRVRRSFGLVMQDDTLLPGSIAENVAFFAEEIDWNWMWECLRIACMDLDVKELPMAENTSIGDVGSFFSAGQRQRLHLARAIYRRPAFLLLDEATSNLDIEREKRVYENLRALNIGRIVVTHRQQSVGRADQVLKLGPGDRQGGRISTLSSLAPKLSA